MAAIFFRRTNHRRRKEEKKKGDTRSLSQFLLSRPKQNNSSNKRAHPSALPSPPPPADVQRLKKHTLKSGAFLANQGYFHKAIVQTQVLAQKLAKQSPAREPRACIARALHTATEVTAAVPTVFEVRWAVGRFSHPRGQRHQRCGQDPAGPRERSGVLRCPSSPPPAKRGQHKKIKPEFKCSVLSRNITPSLQR